MPPVCSGETPPLSTSADFHERATIQKVVDCATICYPGQCCSLGELYNELKIAQTNLATIHWLSPINEGLPVLGEKKVSLTQKATSFF